ncbi:hypothetical protein MKX03_033315 [Papaver bracteatum]|nr:hypothetical protein MKX03_033315 [Papaver bracteatum]
MLHISPYLYDRIGKTYTSKSSKQAELDIAFWFGGDKFDVCTSKKVVFILPGEKIYGPLTKAVDILQLNQFYKNREDLGTVLFMKDMRVFIIQPLAFQERCVGQILNAIECNCVGLRGLTLVKRGADHRSNACLTDSGSLSRTDDDEYCVAVVAQGVKPCFQIVEGMAKDIDYGLDMFRIGR